MITIEEIRNKFQNRRPGIQNAKGYFSVLVPLVEKNGELYILYELRSKDIDTQPGEVCFPGGKIEPGETAVQAALRETWEEIGISSQQINVIAQLDTYHPPSDIVIYPFLAEFTASCLNQLKLNEMEVEECFLVPLSFLVQAPYVYRYSMKPNLGEDFQYEKIGRKENSYNWRPMEHQVISWEYEGKYIWGLTALITKWTIEILTGIRD